ncbi:hypothetical protein ZIOFF_034998 [Zingiber officinale]|uniref:40S ribosomal protein S12 n=1 Tax=Zingiber officinale TaxID=94328 RepID=A0A8J5GLX0_ZINOF|nr:hypothetical protein ZIOFF_034998 [Zingiber officinale]
MTYSTIHEISNSAIELKVTVSEDAVAESAPILGEPMDLMTALQLVLKKSLAHDGLVRGLHEGANAIEKHAAQLCILAEGCDQADYANWLRHCAGNITCTCFARIKIDSEGKARKSGGMLEL